MSSSQEDHEEWCPPELTWFPSKWEGWASALHWDGQCFQEISDFLCDSGAYSTPIRRVRKVDREGNHSQRKPGPSQRCCAPQKGKLSLVGSSFCWRNSLQGPGEGALLVPDSDVKPRFNTKSQQQFLFSAPEWLIKIEIQEIHAPSSKHHHHISPSLSRC